MNAKQIQYALLLAEVGSFSQAAEKLNIAQPSLSKQILNLEQELGVKLFDRSTVSMRLTPAGMHFLKEARELLYQGDQLIHSMEAFRTGERGCLSIGISPFRNLYMMPRFIRLFQQKYPGVQICLHEAASDLLRKNAADGKYDLAIVNLPVDDAVLSVTYLEQERLMVAVPKAMISKLPFDMADAPKEIDFVACKDLPFVVVASGQEMRRYFDKLCISNGISPQIVVEVVGGVTSTWSMARAGLGAALLPAQFVADKRVDEDMVLLAVKDPGYTRQPVVVTRRGQYLSEHAQYAIELLKNLSDE